MNGLNGMMSDEDRKVAGELKIGERRELVRFDS
jgi:hypothetical protein